MDKPPTPVNTGADSPDFLVKTSLGCSLVVLLILIPFTINNFIQDRFVMGLVTSSVAVVALMNIWNGLHGRYSLWVNTYLVTPTATFAIIYAMINLAGPGSYWPILLALAFYFVLPERRAWFFNVLTVLVSIPAAWYVLEQEIAVRFSAVLLGVSLFAFISMREINLLHTQLKEQAVKDKLTGLFNRNLQESSLQQAISQNRRSGLPATIVALDIDQFKAINDSLGHPMGDHVLKGVSDLLQKRIRGSDMAFRVGGEEFIVLLHNTNEDQGATFAEELRQEVEKEKLLPDRQVTVSMGVTSYKDDMDSSSWLKTCDEKLYQAKKSGRNKVVA
ncbi:MAG: GGDEF domain-containing protein [Gammaproteobacteria bacterium]|nr:GGDEF domain-containing protein [Gammaproteobacteria bacterium]MBT4492763.1 GGDEF domain-containing protein [Gammaproteobacteria bacterium]MBT7370948.1 GGDEF domain-containing protein [Gammaproteobacteria bacterium]